MNMGTASSGHSGKQTLGQKGHGIVWNQAHTSFLTLRIISLRLAQSMHACSHGSRMFFLGYGWAMDWIGLVLDNR